MIGTTVFLALLGPLLLTANLMVSFWLCLVIVLVAMLIGFVPLRVLLRDGPDRIVAAWVAAMILRMFASLIGFVILISRYSVEPVASVIGIGGGYFVLLMVETIGMVRLIRGEFERNDSTVK